MFYYNKELDYPVNIIVQLGEIPYNVNAREVEENFDQILTDYFNSERCFLNEREQKVILARYKEKQTLDAIAAEFNLTRERIRQLEVKALTKLKRFRRIFFDSFDDYLAVKNLHDSKRKELIEKVAILDDLLNKAGLLINNKQTTIEEIENFLELSFEERQDVISEHTDIADLNLSVRSLNCLRRSRINTIGELITYTARDLLRIRNMGKKSQKEIINALKDLDLYLKEEE